MAPISAYVRPPAIASRPPRIHAARSSDADGITTAIPPVVRKMPEPMTLPTTNRMADPSPMARTSPSSPAGITAFSACIGPDNSMGVGPRRCAPR